jgi:transaldolase / glucose-6-phosphate isomerase
MVGSETLAWRADRLTLHSHHEAEITVMNALKALQEYGQSIWLDYLRRDLLTGGGLARLIDEDGLRGMTSNPSIFEKAIGGSTDYDAAIRDLLAKHDLEPKALFEQLAIADIQHAADIFRPVYDATRRRDGYVSLEVSPELALDTEATIAEASRLWRAVDRPNIMIKVPGTPAGVPAVRRLTSEGININITLLFAQSAYEAVAAAFIEGLEARAANGADVSGIASVASFFLSRIDTMIDEAIAERLKDAPAGEQRTTLEELRGKVAIAGAKLAYQYYKGLFGGARWQDFARRTGAQTQRLLWASTGTKNPAYSDVVYVEELIGPDTINTLPVATMDAFRDHGRARASLEEGLGEARRVLAAVDRLRLPLSKITDTLVTDGIRLFADSADKLLGAVARKRADFIGERLNRQTVSLGADLQKSVEASLNTWRRNGAVRRLWQRDAMLWTGGDEAKWLGWLGIVDDRLAHLDALQALAVEVKEAGFTDILLLGMGGSSLGPDVLAATFGRSPGFPRLHVLDSTDPAEISAREAAINLGKTLFIVSSKSGTTLEPAIFTDYFFARVKATVGAASAGQHFIAITDPGSALERLAEREGFRRVYHGDPTIGGRYSVLSDFGMVPAAAMGLDVAAFLTATKVMMNACAASAPSAQNPGVVLGTIIGVAAQAGRDKVTIVASSGIAEFGAWLEQLIAESTGKQGKGLIPLAAEALGPPSVYGSDRIFAYLRLDAASDADQDRAIDALQRAGQPVIRIAMRDPSLIGQEFFRWEVATAVAGAIIGINPFDQPDVEASKIKTRELTGQYEKTGKLPVEQAIFERDGIALFTDERNAKELAGPGDGASLASYLKAHLGRLRTGDYCALLAYIERNAAHEAQLQAMRLAIRDARHVATCLGFGPRFLHSTGQAYKGGPNSGVFLQITCDKPADLDVPGRRYSFGTVQAAQARGDFDVLAKRGRRLLRVHFTGDVPAGLAALGSALSQSLG